MEREKAKLKLLLLEISSLFVIMNLLFFKKQEKQKLFESGNFFYLYLSIKIENLIL